ncbi:YegS/Rv2252/BmrU family lipid kinase [Lachnospiraceae bacterium PF1-21]|uniref:diacylglycerol/lipid kinase family protein n=1 Tax=Ohessyouella blattaphilus TaxID=2949333 RepID=UPI003E2C8E8A
MYHFIVNPNARSGLGKSTWNLIEKELIRREVDYQAYETKYQKHATKIARKITETDGIHQLVVLGGDGTINEVINGIYDLDKVCLGYIPIGSSNDFARGFHLPKEPLEALGYILDTPSYAFMDVGYITYKENKKRRFAVSAGIGFDAAVCHEVVVSRLKKFFNKLGLGKLAYTGVAFSQIIKSRPTTMTITVDGIRRRYENVLFATVMNHPYEGGGFKFCPKADSTDGELDVIIAANISKLRFLTLLPLAFKGYHTVAKGIYLLKGKTVEIVSDCPLPVHTDGEPIFLQRELFATLEPKKLKVAQNK